ncbi:MAG: PEGA domain-containing protein [Polyangia bacterium]
MKNPCARAFFPVSRIASVGAAAAFFFSGSQVLAGDNPTVSVLGIETSDGVPDSVAVGVTDALRQRMSTMSGYRLVQGRDLVEVKLVFSCSDEAPACMGQAAKSLGASFLIFGSVKKAGTDAYSVTLKLFDADKEVVQSWTTDQFSRAQAMGPALLGPVQKWIATLTGQSLPGTLHLQGGVVGAAVAVDGVSAGVMGAGGLTIASVAAGQHEIAVTKPGYLPVNKRVTLSAGDTREVAIAMTAESAETLAAEVPAAEAAATVTTETTETLTTTSGRSGGGWTGPKVGAWVALVGGVVGIVVGGVYSYYVSDANSKLDPYRRSSCNISATGYCDKNGKPADPITDPALIAWMLHTKDLGDKYATDQWYGYGVGAALLATSAVLFYVGYRSDSSGATADARASSVHFAPLFSRDGMGAMAFTTF